MGALMAGLLASPHCVVMCGPLAAVVLRGPQTTLWTHAGYQGSRILAFGLLGGLAGGLGSSVLRGLGSFPGQMFPWALGIFFLGLGLRLDRYIPKPKGLMPWIWRVSARWQRLPHMWGAIGLGALTPLVPCGPLYMAAGLALLSGSFHNGFILLFGFGCGTSLLLAPAYLFGARMQRRLPLGWSSRLQRVLACLAACLIFCRLLLGCSGLFGLCLVN